MSIQSLSDLEVYPLCSIEQQDVFMYDDQKTTATSVFVGSESPTYLDISASKTQAFPHIKTEPDTETLMSWTQKHPEYWSQYEILDWIYFVASTIDVDPITIRGEEFQNITGPELCRMTLEDFQRRDSINGKCFYNMFRCFHKDAFFIDPECDYPPKSPAFWDAKQEPTTPTSCTYSTSCSKPMTAESIVTQTTGNELQVLLGPHWYDIDTCVEIPSCFQSIPESEESGYGSSDSDSVSDSSDIAYSTMHRTTSTRSEVSEDEEMRTVSLQPPNISKKKETLPERQPEKAGEQQKQQNRGRKPGQISKGNHLWEFIRDLLKDPHANPNLLRWEEKETGVFRFVQSEAVAQMWGQKKNNSGMTYEKLSRAMRFCRTAGYFAMVPKTGKFPKKLCFRFGAKAYGWKD